MRFLQNDRWDHPSIYETGKALQVRLGQSVPYPVAGAISYSAFLRGFLSKKRNLVNKKPSPVRSQQKTP